MLTETPWDSFTVGGPAGAVTLDPGDNGDPGNLRTDAHARSTLYERGLKRAFDLVAATFLLILVAPTLLLVALAIRIDLWAGR